MSARAPQLPSLSAVYQALLQHFGAQHWWPAESPFEVMVGAILTQNTAWQNVEKALANLRVRGRLDPESIAATRHHHLAGWLRPSGYFNIKATRLQNFCRWYLATGGYAALQQQATGELRTQLLAVNGIGPETADDILLYAFERPVFVIDAYTRRLLARLGLFVGDEPYETLRGAIEQELGANVALFNEYHALIVRHAKQFCRTKPLCADCILRTDCVASKHHPVVARAGAVTAALQEC